MGDTEDAFETLAFGVCNTDGIEGLSWDEVEQCEVSKHEYDFQSFGYFRTIKICRFYWQFLA